MIQLLLLLIPIIIIYALIGFLIACISVRYMGTKNDDIAIIVGSWPILILLFPFVAFMDFLESKPAGRFFDRIRKK